MTDVISWRSTALSARSCVLVFTPISDTVGVDSMCGGGCRSINPRQPLCFCQRSATIYRHLGSMKSLHCCDLLLCIMISICASQKP